MDSPFNAFNPDPRQLEFDGPKTLLYTLLHILKTQGKYKYREKLRGMQKRDKYRQIGLQGLRKNQGDRNRENKNQKMDKEDKKRKNLIKREKQGERGRKGSMREREREKRASKKEKVSCRGGRQRKKRD